MDYTSIQMTLGAALILTAVTLASFYEHRRRQRQHVQVLRVQTPNEPALQEAKKPAKEPIVATASPSRPSVQAHVERERVTIKVVPPVKSSPWQSELPAFTIDAALWERLIASQPAHLLLKSAPASAVARSSKRPCSCEELLEDRTAFTGLVVSIGVNDTDSSMWHSQGMMQSVSNFVSTLLSQNDYYCRTAFDEFIMVCPGEQGSISQRRLNYISERLWDYQLRGIGASAILFSWGGIQVQNEPLADAVAAAIDRMRQTKRLAPSAKSALTKTSVV